MKTALTVVLVVVASVFMMSCMMGCLSAQQQAEVNRSTILLAEKLQEVAKLEDQLKDIAAKLNAGTIPVAEGRALYSDIETSIAETTAAAEGFQATLDKINSEGASGLDVTTGIILSLAQIAANLGIIRVWRGGVNNRAGDIGVRTPTP